MQQGVLGVLVRPEQAVLPPCSRVSQSRRDKH